MFVVFEQEQGDPDEGLPALGHEDVPDVVEEVAGVDVLQGQAEDGDDPGRGVLRTVDDLFKLGLLEQPCLKWRASLGRKSFTQQSIW